MGLATRVLRLEATEPHSYTAPTGPLALAAAVGFEADPWQAEVLGSRANRVLLLCCRQSGKSTTSALLGLQEVLAGGLCLVLSPTERQSVELVRKARGFLGALGSGVRVVAESSTTLELDQGGRLVALPGYHEGNIRGYSSVGLLLIDEASRVDDTLYASARPMLAVSGGRLVALSTPWGKRGWFWREWTEGAADWLRVRVPATDCPRIPASFLEEERASLGDLAFRSEYLVEFVDTASSAFDSAEVLAALDRTIKPFFGGVAA